MQYLSFSVWLISLSIFPRSIHVVRNVSMSFLSYGWMIFLCVCVYIYISHFIHSSVNRHTQIVSESWLLWIMLQWTWGVQVSLWDSDFISLAKVGLLDHMVVVFLIFWGDCILFYIMAAPTYLSTNSAKGSFCFSPDLH